jgi:hypothetical protein
MTIAEAHAKWPGLIVGDATLADRLLFDQLSRDAQAAIVRLYGRGPDGDP